MATTAQSPNDLTRQQLDELDDLLQRMLSLPLNPPESFANLPSAQNFSAPLPTPVPAPVAREIPAPVTAPAQAPRVVAPRVPDPVKPLAAWQPPPSPSPEPLPTAAAFEWPASKSAKTVPAAPTHTPAAPEPVSFVYAPFVAFNAVWNWVLGLFGFPGRVVRSGFVKTLFGLAGIGLIAYTGLKVAQIHGWVTLPQELPWPR